MSIYVEDKFNSNHKNLTSIRSKKQQFTDLVVTPKFLAMILILIMFLQVTNIYSFEQYEPYMDQSKLVANKKKLKESTK